MHGGEREINRILIGSRLMVNKKNQAHLLSFFAHMLLPLMEVRDSLRFSLFVLCGTHTLFVLCGAHIALIEESISSFRVRVSLSLLHAVVVVVLRSFLSCTRLPPSLSLMLCLEPRPLSLCMYVCMCVSFCL